MKLNNQKNQIEVSFNNLSKAKYERSYKPLDVGQNVRFMIKKTTTTKGTDAKRSREVYIIIAKKDNEYIINEHNRRKVYLRHELREAS